MSHRFPTAGASTASTAPASAYIFGDSFWELVCGIPTLRTLAYTKLPKGDDQSLATHIVKGLVFSNILRAFEAPIDWLVRVGCHGPFLFQFQNDRMSGSDPLSHLARTRDVISFTTYCKILRGQTKPCLWPFVTA